MNSTAERTSATLSQSADKKTDDHINILLVDDDARNLDVLESILTSPDYRLVRAQSADEALHALVTESFAVLVLDVRMPITDGLELAGLIKQRKRTQHLPIIFLTAYYHEDEHVLQGYDVGAVDYLSKPCNPAVLRSKVAVFADLFRVNRALREEIAERQQAEQRVAERSAEVQLLVRQLRALATQLTQAEIRERRRMSKILHDHVQQILVSAKMQLGFVRQSPDPANLMKMLEDAEALLKEALEISRSLTVELNPPVLQEAGLVAGIEWLAQRMAEKHQFTVHVVADPPSDPYSEEDRFLLFECTRELLFNIVKHAEVTEAQVSVLRAIDGRIMIVVEDHGIGFDVEQIHARGGEQPTFGLFSIQQRLAHLGGQFTIDSTPGKGARITLISPSSVSSFAPSEVAEAAGSGQDALSQKRRSGNGPIRVLIVDDHNIVRECLARVLSCEADIEVVGEAKDGQQAIDLAELLQPEIIIMDINLGAMSGVDATKVIVSRNPQIKVIGLSVHVEQAIANALRNAGAVNYLTKDVDSNILIEAIRASANHESLVQAGR
jgi:signal transduction histidine kinase